MKKKIQNREGFTLIEMLVTILILVIMVVAVGDGMSAATRIYKESVFFSNSSALASMLNTTLEDLLRYSEEIYTKPDGSADYTSPGRQPIDGASVPGNPDFLFTNEEYGAKHAYIEENSSPIVIRNVFGGQSRELLNAGAYPNLKIKEDSFTATYNGPIYTIRYVIASTQDESMEKSVEITIRVLNEYNEKIGSE